MKGKARHTKERDCRKIFSVLSEYLDGELDPAFCKTLEKHMRGCDPCEAFLATLRKTVDLCHDYEAPLSTNKQIPGAVKRRMKAAYLELIQKTSRSSK